MAALFLQNYSYKPMKPFFITLLLYLFLCSCSNDNNVPIEPNIPEEEIDIPSTNTVGVTQKKLKVFDGYTLFTSSKSTDTYLINNCGQVINKWTSKYKSGKSVYLLENGSILRAGEILNENIAIGGIGGAIEIKDWNDNLIWSYEYSSDQFSHHHDAIPLKNGNILLLIATRKNLQECIDAGRDPETLTDSELYNEQIIEIEPIGNNAINIVWEWNIWDHLVQDFDSTKANFGTISENPQLMDINYIGRYNGKADWLHANSIQYNEDLDEIIISFQGTSEFMIIDHSTTSLEAASSSGGKKGKGGDILYRWGNPAVYQLGTENDRTLYGQHYPHWIPNNYSDGGKILVFNNGLDRESPVAYSSVDLISPTKDNNGNYSFTDGLPFAPKQPEWQYKNIGSFLSEIISSAQRLPNGNTLICEGQRGHFFEINTNDEIIWEYVNPESGSGILKQGDEGVDNAVFRAFKYSTNYPAFKNKTLTPGSPIELDPNLGNCM
ncbi:aryl-sulfate sulfotransferase [Aestuariibaculum sp. YM273]|uniref:aryl-sulfate sulfotransferase n=1 Tax=Aestuariibaculum sp. YM273 TaxID=3070659 RepID=UPI0027DD73DA|nr:aryl-sulfate sulfotransferase [Aestuariibaculum sp. YM273]WMI66098.1 aryl-sulfate sulfotransferase [Aestuariibaculum sp. YM273]